MKVNKYKLLRTYYYNTKRGTVTKTEILKNWLIYEEARKLLNQYKGEIVNEDKVRIISETSGNSEYIEIILIERKNGRKEIKLG